MADDETDAAAVDVPPMSDYLSANNDSNTNATPPVPDGSRRRVRVGIDVGGTFTKSVAIDSADGSILSAATVPTTHDSARGVSDGILDAFTKMTRDSGLALDDIELVAHSTTQAINALLENDTYPVGIIAMGVGPTKKDVIRRTELNANKDSSEIHRGLRTFHEFLDTSHLISEQEVSSSIERLRESGARCIVATEAYGVDDPTNEEFVAEQSARAGLPCTSSHEISGTYGLEIRTLTAAVNASIMPKTLQVADFVEGAMRGAGVLSPLLVMRGDGGVTSMETFRSKPILTVLSGPAASVAGALLHLRVTNGIFVEVGGTSTNICIIRNARPEIRYVTIRDHPTCIRSMDVRIVGVAGGSMVAMSGKKVGRVGPRSAHIAGLKYSCYANASQIESGDVVMISPKPNDAPEYAAIKCPDGTTYAITNTCAANALGIVPDGDYSEADAQAAKASMKKLGQVMGVSYSEVAMSILLTSTYEISNAISGILREYKMRSQSTMIIGGGGGASVLVPEVAKLLQMRYERAPYAEVISSIGVASSMLQDEMDVAMSNPTPDLISKAHKRAREALIKKGAVAESVTLDSVYIPEKAILRITSVGSVQMSAGGAGGADTGPAAAFGSKEAISRASEITEMPEAQISIEFESDHYLIAVGRTAGHRLFRKKVKYHVLVLDRLGRTKLNVPNGLLFWGGKQEIVERLDRLLESRHSGIAPPVHMIDDTRMLDFSGLTSASHIVGAIRDELEDDADAAVVVEL